VRVFDLDESEGIHFLTMEFVEGRSLRELDRRARADAGAGRPCRRRGSSAARSPTRTRAACCTAT
jgi:hypothetical protein